MVMNEKFEYRQAVQAIDWARRAGDDGATADALELVLEYARTVAERLARVQDHNKLGDGS